MQLAKDYRSAENKPKPTQSKAACSRIGRVIRSYQSTDELRAALWPELQLFARRHLRVVTLTTVRLLKAGNPTPPVENSDLPPVASRVATVDFIYEQVRDRVASSCGDA